MKPSPMFLKTWRAILGMAALSGLGCGTSDTPSVELVERGSFALSGLPAAWTYADIGLTGAQPSAPTHDPATGAFTVPAGMGTGPNHGDPDASDHYRFVYRHVTGDVEIVARLSRLAAAPGTSLENSTIGVAIRADANVSGAAIPPNDDEARTGTGVFQVKLRPPLAEDFDGNEISTYVRGAFKTPLGATGVYDGRDVQTPVWLRLRRIGKDFAVTYRTSDGGPWEQAGAFGGEFTNPGAYVGFFAAGRSGPVEATFDNVYVGPPRSDNRSTWVGSSSSQLSSGILSRGMHSLYVGENAGVTRIFKHVSNSEGPPGVNLFDKDGKQLRLPGADPAWVGAYVNQGAIAGEGGVVYIAAPRANKFWDGPFCVNRFSFDLDLVQGCPAGVNLERIGGMIARAGKIYVSQPTLDRVVVLDGATLDFVGSFPVTSSQTRPLRPSALAMDTSSNPARLWVLQGNTDYPNPGNYVTDPQKYAEIRCYETAGTSLGTPCGEIRATTLTSNYTALAYHPGENRLLIADNGPEQNVFLVGSLYTANKTWTTLGQPGGAFGGATPGLAFDPGAGGQTRFYNPAAVAVDGSGAIYVASGTDTLDLRKFTPAGTGFTADWSKPVHGIGAAMLDFDPSSDGRDAYSPGFHFKLDYAQTAPGAEWSLHSLTHNTRASYVERDAKGNVGRRGYAPLLRNLPATGAPKRTLFLWGQHVDTNASAIGYVSHVDIYRFSGEIAVPAGAIEYVCNPSTLLGNLTLWRDDNADGVRGPGDTVVTNFGDGAVKLSCVQQFVVDVDKRGDLWIDLGSDNRNSGTKYPLWQVKLQGFTGAGTVLDVPVYDIVTAGKMIPQPFDGTLGGTSYDSDTDTLYAWGVSPLVPSAASISAYGNFTQTNRYVRFAKPLVMRSTMPNSDNGPQRGLGRAGDKLFVSDRYGAVYVFEASDGTPVTTLTAGPEGSGIQAWQDIHMGLRAFQRSSGEYVVNVYDTFTLGRHLLHRYTPRACEASVGCTATDACVGYFRVEEASGTSFIDSSGFANTATGTSGAARAPAWEGPGISLATGNYATVRDATSLALRDAATLAAWVKPTRNDRLQYVLKKGSSYELGLDASGKPFVQFNGTPSGRTCLDSCRVTAPASVSSTTFTHVAATYDRSKVRLYVNGITVAETPFQGPIVPNNVRLGIGAPCTDGTTGCAPNPTTALFQGLLDEVRLFARPLPEEQIAILARRGPIVNLTFEDGPGEMIQDTSGACNGGVAFAADYATSSDRPGGLRDFTAALSFVEVSPVSELNSGRSFTLAAWAKPRAVGSAAVIKKALPAGDGYELGLTSTGRVFARLRVGGESYEAHEPVTMQPVPANAWVHLAATYDGSTLRVYRGKVLTGQAAVSSFAAFSNRVPLTIAAASDGTQRYIGLLDDVRVYRRSLSSTEVAGLP